MKVGKEISPSKITSNKIIRTALVSKKTKRLSLSKAALAILGALALVLLPAHLRLNLASAAGVNPWWPADGAHVSGTQPFKAELQGTDVSQYEMFWQVDGGSWNWMDSSYADYQHKEASVDVSQWTWRGSGPYQVTFIARQNGAVVATRSVAIYVDNGLLAQQASAPQTSAPAPAASSFYVDSNSSAASQASQWRTSRPNDAAKMDILAAQPTAKWFGNWSGDIQSAVSQYVSAASSAGKVPVLVAYNLPQRDCGGYSAGGTNDYTNWIGGFARGIGSNKAVVILEPDSLSMLNCLSASDQKSRLSLLSGAVSVLKSNPNTAVYLDAGHGNWIDAAVMAGRLGRANVQKADGFALNVSNFMPVDEETSYGSQISAQLGGKHFLIDTSRDGNGSNGEWCNPWGRVVGKAPSMNTSSSLVDAYLWIKIPGESDGNCNGGPSAGAWWPDYALSLVK